MRAPTTETEPSSSQATPGSDQVGGEGFLLCDEIIMAVAEEIARELTEYRSLIERLAAGKAGPKDTPARIIEALRKTGVTLGRFHADLKNGPGTAAHCVDRQLVARLQKERETLAMDRKKLEDRLTQLYGEPAHSEDQLAALLATDPNKSQHFRSGDPRNMSPHDRAGHEANLKNDIECFTREKNVEIPDKLAAIDRRGDDLKRMIGALHVRL